MRIRSVRARAHDRDHASEYSLDGITSLPDHTDDGARVHVADETGEEGLGREVGVVLLEVLLAGGGHLQSDELRSHVEVGMLVSDDALRNVTQVWSWTYLVAPLLKSRDDVTDESSLDTVGL